MGRPVTWICGFGDSSSSSYSSYSSSAGEAVVGLACVTGPLVGPPPNWGEGNPAKEGGAAEGLPCWRRMGWGDLYAAPPGPPC